MPIFMAAHGMRRYTDRTGAVCTAPVLNGCNSASAGSSYDAPPEAPPEAAETYSSGPNQSSATLPPR